MENKFLIDLLQIRLGLLNSGCKRLSTGFGERLPGFESGFGTLNITQTTVPSPHLQIGADNSTSL